MTTRPLLVLCALVLSSACVKEITSDERLERETARSDALRSNTAAELGKIKCEELNADLGKARDPVRTEEERLSTFTDVYERLKNRAQRFEEAFSRNPDLAFQEGSQELVNARESCIQMTADVRLELESLIREIMQVLVVDEVKGGQTIKVARIDFSPLRGAIEKLELDDRENLFNKINNAEKQVDVKAEKRSRGK
ncbi:MAG: hypothetical protein MUC96_15980 [Myxococcaceae bacterium]|nr:hypothetical protein [Myxococcaceae bacterium]